MMTWKVVFEIGPYQYYETYVTAESHTEAVMKAEAEVRGGYQFPSLCFAEPA